MKRSSEFRRVKEKGENYRGRYMALGVLREEPRESGVCVGFITTKRLGNAVTRNLVRRRMRALVIETGAQLETGLSLVLIARHHAANAEFAALRKEWKWLCHRAKLFSNRDL